MYSVLATARSSRNNQTAVQQNSVEEPYSKLSPENVKSSKFSETENFSSSHRGANMHLYKAWLFERVQKTLEGGESATVYEEKSAAGDGGSILTRSS